MRRSSSLRLFNGSMTISGLQKIKDDEAAVDAYRRNPPEPAPVFDPLTLTTMQQAALMQMMESHVKRAVIARLLEDSQDRPGASEYCSLVDLGLAELKVGKRYHDVTYDGAAAGRALTQSLCRKFNIHLLIESTAHRLTVMFKCPCGWHTTVDKGRFTNSNANARFQKHIATAEGMNKLVVALRSPQRVGG